MREKISLLFILILSINFVSAMTATINIPEKYTQVNAGEKVYFETGIKWPENTGRKDLRMEYSIKNQNNEEIAYIKVLKAIETQISSLDSISIPKTTREGTYKIFLTINDYEELNNEVVASFEIIKNSKKSIDFYLLIILGIVCMIAIVVVVELFILIRKNG